MGTLFDNVLKSNPFLKKRHNVFQYLVHSLSGHGYNGVKLDLNKCGQECASANTLRVNNDPTVCVQIEFSILLIVLLYKSQG